MGLKEGLIAELKHESGATKRILEKVPVASLTWKPHERSMTLGRLASHVAETPAWVSNIIHIDSFDFQTNAFEKNNVASIEELLDLFEKIKNKAVADLESIDADDFEKIWTVRSGTHVIYELPKKVALRGWAYSHLYHHRGQLSVYLRLLDIPVPGMYGPSADETM